MNPKLELIDLTKFYDDHPAVNQLSLHIETGEFVSLLGPSGCGKSTTLAMIAGFTEPDHGEILVDGKSIVANPPQRRRLGLVFQDYALFSKMSVRSNLAFGLEVLGLPRQERRIKTADLASRLGLTHLLDQSAGRLNMSEMQRVALARVLITAPQILLLDEPMSNLDAAVRLSLRTELKQIQKSLRQSVLYVTHDQVEAMSMSDRIAVMNDGRIQQIGTPDIIYNRPINRFVAEFIGDPPINILPCTLKRSGSELAAVTELGDVIPLKRSIEPHSDIEIGIRPHDIRLTGKTEAITSPLTVKFLEDLGSEHILHVEYGSRLLTVASRPGMAKVGETVSVGFDPGSIHVIEQRTGLIVSSSCQGST
jgi:multiple sugar transport system ATP-binding protein